MRRGMLWNRHTGWMRRALFIAIAFGGAACSDCDLSVETTVLPDAFVNTPYGFNLDSDCGGDAWFVQTGDLPPGIGLQENGDLEGVPTREGDFTFTVGVFDFGSNETAFGGLELRVHPQSDS